MQRVCRVGSKADHLGSGQEAGIQKSNGFYEEIHGGNSSNNISRGAPYNGIVGPLTLFLDKPVSLKHKGDQWG